jgi:hypothetical protein
MAPEAVPDGSIVITPKEFYDGVRSDIAEIKAAVSPLPDLKVRVDGLERRVGVLERRMWMSVGFATALGVTGTLLVQLLAK